MHSQVLIVDLVRNWHKLGNNSRFSNKDLEYCTLSLVNVPVEYEGTEDFSAMILWDQIEPKAKAEGEINETHADIFKVIKRFAIGVGGRISSVVHHGRTTEIKLKSETAKNVADFEWMEINLDEHKRLE